MIHAMLKEIIDDDRAYDPWGAAIGAAFTFCDVLYVEGESALIPSGLAYRPGMGTTTESCVLDSDWAGEILDALSHNELDYEDLEYALKVLDAYLDLLRRANRDY